MEFDYKKLLDKEWWRSKTLLVAAIFGSIGTVLAFGQDTILQFLPAEIALMLTGYIMMINNGMASILRFFTKHGLLPVGNKAAKIEAIAKDKEVEEIVINALVSKKKVAEPTGIFSEPAEFSF